MSDVLSHEQSIRDRVAKEQMARISKPSISPGSIVLCEMPATRETHGETRIVPAIVVKQDEYTNDLTLASFHLGGVFYTIVQPGRVEVIIGPDAARVLADRINDLESTIADMNQTAIDETAQGNKLFESLISRVDSLESSTKKARG